MVDRVVVPAQEGVSNTPAVDNTNARPQWLPEKFSSAEDMAKSYTDLEKEYTRLRQQSDPKATGSPEPKPTVTGKPDAQELFKKEEKPEAPQTLEDVKSILPGFDENKILEFSNTAWETGSLTDAQYGELKKAGYSREIVDQYIQGQMALVETQRASLINAGGGEQAVEAMFSWASQNLSESEVAQYNAKFEGGGSDALMAMEHLKGRFANSGKAGDIFGKQMVGANAPAVSHDVYTSTAQVMKDMQSQEYKHDPAFRQKVAEKLGRSKVL